MAKKLIVELTKGDKVIDVDAIEPQHYQLSALMRIADATEKMSGNYESLIIEARKYFDWYMIELEKVNTLERQIRSLKGVITKLKKKQNN